MKGITRLLAMLLALTIVGATGLCWIEGWSFFDSLYATVVTLTTVGFGDFAPKTVAGRAFIMLYLVSGIGVFVYGIASFGEVLVQAQFRTWLGKRRLDTALKTLSDHFIVCGFGRMGESVCRQLRAKGLPFVVVERAEDVVEECIENEWPSLVGDATDDRILQAAGIERARGLAAVLGNDADNLFIVLSARLARPDMLILARAGDDKAVKKMEKAGADRVVSLYTTGATKIVQLLASPNVEDFIEIAIGDGREIDLAEFQVSEKADYAGQSLAETNLSSRGIIVVSICRSDGEILMPPPGSAVLQPGDSLIALGRRDVIDGLIAES